MNKRVPYGIILTAMMLLNFYFSQAQKNDSGWWHGIQRELRYRPDGQDIVITNGTKRFNRALYGGNTAFRAEAGDLPEFALYLPGMGGNLRLGVKREHRWKWFTKAGSIEARYRPGCMIYLIKDRLIDSGIVKITALPLFDKEGIIVKIEAKNIPYGVILYAEFGGATGNKFSRDGDIGADPESSFDYKYENCKGNVYDIKGNVFTLSFNSKKISGIFPDIYPVHGINGDTSCPAITSNSELDENEQYFLLMNGDDATYYSYADIPQMFQKAEAERKDLADRIHIVTPDPYINTVGGVLSIAADAIWESPSYMHGAVAWRMRLNGWRGAYAADVLGWHDRARQHFNSYALSQVTTPPSGPVVMDTALHLARHLEKLGTGLFTSGYISRNPGGDQRAHHYDMNLVFIDQLLDHFYWTGDTAYVRQCWPLLSRHLAWEKRNFDADGDGLYDAYAAIWASDALQYSGGGVTHTSAYNYRANFVAADLAKMIGEDPTPYKNEAAKILQAMNKELWMPDKGWFAEYKDLLGLKRVHPAAGLWTVYHAIDSKVPDTKQTWQLLRYVDNHIPHIPVRAKGLNDTSLYVLSTTNWQPYTWSLNNVVLAENIHTALAYWQGGRNEEAFRLWKSMLIESMYLGSSPGNLEQISFYDAVRGELYRDFADGIGITARSLVEGLFGFSPDGLHDILYIHPGFPANWSHASISTPDFDFSFVQKANADNYHIVSRFHNDMEMEFTVPSRASAASVTVNNKPARWRQVFDAIGRYRLKVSAPALKEYDIVITWTGKKIQWKQPGDADAAPVKRTMHGPRTSRTVYFYPDEIDLSDFFNDKVTNIFSNQYLSPRPTSATLQLPTQGIGNWAYPLATVNINDSGLRARAGSKNEIITRDGTRFRTPSQPDKKNIVFTSLWDNYPDSVVIPLSGKASYASLLMAGSTNPMQSRFTNGEVIVKYKDGTSDALELKNPENWWPIEQDYYEDGYAFTTGAPKPLRVYLETGEDTRDFNHFTTIRGFSNRGIDGGAATVLELPLSPAKELQNLTLKTTANDVVIGLMSITLKRPGLR